MTDSEPQSILTGFKACIVCGTEILSTLADPFPYCHARHTDEEIQEAIERERQKLEL